MSSVKIRFSASATLGFGLLPGAGAPGGALRRSVEARGVSLEFMSLGAACRTYNVLAHERRAVVAGLFP